MPGPEVRLLSPAQNISMVSPYLKLFRNRNFTALWLGQIISQFGDRLTQMAIIGLVYQKRGADTLSLAVMLSFTIIPVFLINPFAGAYIDRWDKRNTMATTDFIRGLLMLIIGLYLINLHSLMPLYAVIFFVFCLGRFFIPAKMAIIPSIIKDPKHIFTANSLISTTATVAAMLGFGIGGIIVEKLGAKGGFLIDSFTFFISSLLLLSIIRPKTSKFSTKDIIDLSKDVLSQEKSLLKEIKEGTKYIFSHQGTLFSLRSLSVLFSCIGALYVTFIVFIQNTLGSATKDLGFLVVWMGVGILAGSMIYGRIAHKFSLYKTINTMLTTSSLFLLGFVLALKEFPQPVLANTMGLVLGSSIAPIIVAANSLIHNKSQDKLWGRIFSAQEVVIHFFFIAFMFLSSLAAKIFSSFTIIVFIGIIIFSSSLGLLIFGRER